MAVADSYSTNEDTALTVPAAGVLTNDTDVEGDPLTAVLVNGPENGTLTLNADGSFTYTPDANFNGADSFTYKANDGTLDSAPVTVNLTVNAVDDAPVANADSYSTNEDTALTIPAAGVLANDTDVENDPLQAALVQGPAHGSLTLNADGSFTYTPDANFNGADSFTYKANDGTLDSAPVTVSLTVNPVDDAPAAVADSYTTNEDTKLTVPVAGVLANDTDVENDPLQAVLVQGPAHGDLTLNPDGSFTYTPDANYNGADSFTYKANDGTLDSDPVTVSLTVNPVDDAPVAVADSYSTKEDTALIIAATGVLTNDTDVEGDKLTAILDKGPSHGTLTLNADGSFTYTPDANFNGADSFTYKANDGSLNSAPVTVSLAVNPVNDAPVATGDSYSTNEDTSLTIAAKGVLANDTDVDGDPLHAVLVQGPAHGSLTLNPGGSFTYTPAADFNGADSFTYKANDGLLDSAPVTVSLTVNAVNDAPAGTDKTIVTAEDTSHAFTAADFGFTDPHDSPANALLAVKITTLPDAGALLLSGVAVTAGQFVSVADIAEGLLTFKPGADGNGADYADFTFQVQDNGGTANGGANLDPTANTITIDVTPVNDAPVAHADSYLATEDTTLTIGLDKGVLANDTDVDGDSLTASVVSGPAHGSLTLNANGTFTYTPTKDFGGSDSFTYQVDDGHGGKSTGTATITVDAVADAPTISATASSTGGSGGSVNQFSAYDGSDAKAFFAPTLLGDNSGIHILSAGYTGAAGAASTYQGLNFGAIGNHTFALGGGILLTSGSGTPALTNNSPSSTVQNGTAGDSVLDNLAHATTHDASELTLTFTVPTGTSAVSFDFMFGSEEFPEFLNQFPDIAAIIVDGTNYAYFNNDPSQLLNINTQSVGNFYANGTATAAGEAGQGTLGIQYDGISAPLRVIALLGPGTANPDGTTTHTVKIAVADTTDFQYDSGIFVSNFKISDGTSGGIDPTPVSLNPTEDTPVALGITAQFGDFLDGSETHVVKIAAPPAGWTVVSLNGWTHNADGSFSLDVTNSLDASGKFSGAGPTLLPPPNFNGTVNLQVQAIATENVPGDPNPANNTAVTTTTLAINVAPVNDAPVAVDDTNATNENAVLTVSAAAGLLSNDTDVDGDALTVVGVQGGGNVGSAVHLGSGAVVTVNSDGSYQYDPHGAFDSLAAGQHATDSFTYKISDGHGGFDTGTATITVNGVNNVILFSSLAGPAETLDVSGGGGQALDGGPGDDVLVLTDNKGFDHVDGGGTLPVDLQSSAGDVLAFNGVLDLTQLDAGKIQGIETISMADKIGGAGADTLVINAADVIDIGTGHFAPGGANDASAVRVDGDGSDALQLTGGGWHAADTPANAPAGYALYVHSAGAAGTPDDAYVLVQTAVKVTTS